MSFWSSKKSTLTIGWDDKIENASLNAMILEMVTRIHETDPVGRRQVCEWPQNEGVSKYKFCGTRSNYKWYQGYFLVASGWRCQTQHNYKGCQLDSSMISVDNTS